MLSVVNPRESFRLRVVLGLEISLDNSSVITDTLRRVQDLVKTAKAMADSTRVRILVAVRERELCVCQLCDSLEVTQSTLSTHLQVLRAAGLITGRREGRWMYYQCEPGARARVDGIFQSFGPALAADRVLLADARRLGKQSSPREDSSCCLSRAGSAVRKKDRP